MEVDGAPRQRKSSEEVLVELCQSRYEESELIQRGWTLDSLGIDAYDSTTFTFLPFKCDL